MSLEIKAKIDVRKILKEHLFTGTKGKYLDVAFFKNANGRDQYDKDGFIVQEISKEARAKGEKGPIIGNWAYFDKKPASASPPPEKAAKTESDEDDDVPF